MVFTLQIGDQFFVNLNTVVPNQGEEYTRMSSSVLIKISLLKMVGREKLHPPLLTTIKGTQA
jgi:hypothetical protein